LSTLSVGSGSPLLAQQPQPLGKLIAEYADPFSSVSGLRELSDGRLIVTDGREKLIQLVNFRTGQATRISREGAGPGEYAIAGRLLPLPNDQTLLVDLGNQRFMRIGTDGKVVETISPPQLPVTLPPEREGQLPPQAAAFLGRLMNPQGVDQQGRLYFQANSFGSGEAGKVDSVPILRWTIGQSRVDSVGWARLPPGSGGTVVSGRALGGGGMVAVRTIGSGGGGGFLIWAPVETWQVAPDGRIARVVPQPYQVTWFGLDRRGAAGPVVPYTPIRVTEADREAYRQQIQTGGSGLSMTTALRVTAAAPAGGGNTRGQMPDLPFAETLPPFWDASNSVRVSPDGHLWILRMRPASDKIPVYDVFDQTGRLVRKVSLAPRSHIVGFGRTSVYVVRKDEDDLEYLQQFAR